MPAVRTLSALALLAGLALGACSQPAGDAAEAGDPAPAAAPAALTDAQKAALLAELPEPYRSADLAKGEARLPAGRFGTAEESAATALLLAGPQGGFYVGATLSPNGGDVMH